MIIVSGCPRSGTSLMMELLRCTFGDDRIRGEKFPSESRGHRKMEDESEEAFSYREFINGQSDPLLDKKKEKSRDMNPNGFWENQFTVRGIQYSVGMSDVFKEIQKEQPPTICKVVSQGLVNSDPAYVDRVVYLLRDPGSVSKSQERLSREMFVTDHNTGERINFWEGASIIEPRMFIDVSVMAARWFNANPDIPLLVVRYDDLVTKPDIVLFELEEFLGEGDFSKAENVVDTNLNRSGKYVLDHPMAGEAFDVYHMMEREDWNGVIEYAKSRNTQRALEVMQWECARRGCTTNTMLCNLCRNDKQMMESFKRAATDSGVDWKSMPCGYDCGMGCGNDNPISIEESIKNNHWIQGG